MRHVYEILQKRKPELMGHEDLLNYAVLVPLVEVNGEWNVLFEERAHHLKRQPGEICFPGGRVDPNDRNEKDAAVRETCEELGLTSQDIELIGPLDYIVSSFHRLYPFVGKISGLDKIRPNPDEVAGVFYVPLEHFQKNAPELHFADLKVTPPDDFPFDWIPNGRNYKWRSRKTPEYFYFYKDRIIWGLTARILRHFIGLISATNEK